MQNTQVLAASQSPLQKKWFQGTADAVRQYLWLFENSDARGRRGLPHPGRRARSALAPPVLGAYHPFCCVGEDERRSPC